MKWLNLHAYFSLLSDKEAATVNLIEFQIFKSRYGYLEKTNTLHRIFSLTSLGAEMQRQ